MHRPLEVTNALQIARHRFLRKRQSWPTPTTNAARAGNCTSRGREVCLAIRLLLRHRGGGGAGPTGEEKDPAGRSEALERYARVSGLTLVAGVAIADDRIDPIGRLLGAADFSVVSVYPQWGRSIAPIHGFAGRHERWID
jgi:hypothetical protein